MKTTRRGLNLLDAMILVAALAIGLALARAALPEADPRRPGRGAPASLRASYRMQAAHDVALPCVGMLTVAFLIVRLRPPRPRPVDLIRQPGAVAGVVALVGMGVVASVRSTLTNAFFLPIYNGMTVGFAWVMIWSHGAWKAEPGWIDRLGRVLGVCWMSLPIVLYVGLSI